MKKIRRKRFLVDRPLQLGLAANMILLQLVVAAVTAGVVVWFVLFALDDRLTCQLDADFVLKIAIILAFISFGVAIWGVRYTHSIAGPIFKTRMLLRSAATGGPPDPSVAFRRSDAFKELSEDLNGLFQTMRHWQKRLNDQAEHLAAIGAIAAASELTPEDRLEKIALLVTEAEPASTFSSSWLTKNPEEGQQL